MFKIIVTFLLTLMTLIAYGTDAYMLPKSFGFYKGSVPMSTIETITFSRDAPDIYDECWDADLAGSGAIKGYRQGTDVTITGNYIYANRDCSYMFTASKWSNLTEINGLHLLNTSFVESMELMFNGTLCSELNGIGEWDVTDVKTFAGMFQGSSNSGDIKLTSLDISRWDTSSAEDMSHMFYGCGELVYIPVENWDVSNVTTFSHMFADCYNLESIDVSNWETVSVISFDAIFNDCRSVKVMDVSGLDTGSCVQFSQMFEGCENLEYIYGLEKWDVTNASYYAFSETFHRCYKLKELDIGSWRAYRVDNMARMFKDCRSLAYIDISGLRGSGDVVDIEIFDGCDRLKEIVR